MTRLTRQEQEVIESLQDYLTRIAHNMVRTHFHQSEPEDLLSVMNLHIVEKATGDPTFLNQQPGYISRSAAWAARDYARRERHGQALQPQLMDQETDDGQAFAETIPAPAADQDLSIDIQNALETLDSKRQEIARMLVAGYQRKEIAKHFGVSSPALAWDFQVIGKALAGAL